MISTGCLYGTVYVSCLFALKSVSCIRACLKILFPGRAPHIAGYKTHLRDEVGHCTPNGGTAGREVWRADWV